jgi:hypothetical protein
MKDKDVSKAVQGLIREQEKASGRPKPLPASSSQIRTLPQAPHGFVNSKKKKDPGAWTVQASDKEPIAMPKACKAAADLASNRVQRLHVKGPNDTLKEMARSQEGASQKMGKVSKKTEPTQKEGVATDQDQLWRDLLKAKEERLFQIDCAIQ